MMDGIYTQGGAGMLPNIANFGGQSLPPVNPMMGEHLFFQGAGGGPTVKNPGTVQWPQQGNPLYYGQTGAYTGPGGPTDAPAGMTNPAPPPAAAQPAQEMTMGDVVRMMFPGSYGEPGTMQGGLNQFANSLMHKGDYGDQAKPWLPTDDYAKWAQSNIAGMGDAYDPAKMDQLVEYMNRIDSSLYDKPGMR